MENSKGLGKVMENDDNVMEFCVYLRYRADNGRLRRQNEELQGKVEWTTRQCRELNNRLTQLGLVQEKMKERLHELDGQAQLASQQVSFYLHLHLHFFAHKYKLCGRPPQYAPAPCKLQVPPGY